MSWSMYEPVDSVTNTGNSSLQIPGQMQMPQMQYKNEHVAQPMQQLPSNMAAPKKTGPANAVPVPVAAPAKTTWEDISDIYELGDWSYLLVAAVVVEVVVIAITRFFPAFSGKYLNLWYSRFKLSAVLADVVSVLIGFGLAKYFYTEVIYPKADWNPLYFTGTAIVIQVIHDILFYFGIIKQVPEGKNGILDVMRSYGEAGGAKLVLGDSVIMAGTSVGAMLLKATSPHLVLLIGLVAAYSLPYFMEVKNEFSGLS
jgi:hypothetical protein